MVASSETLDLLCERVITSHVLVVLNFPKRNSIGLNTAGLSAAVYNRVVKRANTL